MAKPTIDEMENVQRSINGLHELSVDVSDSPIANADIVPVPVRKRTWGWWHIACLWIGMAVCIPTYMLAAGLISAGMSYKQAIGTILFGNAIVLIPLVLNAHAGTKYGIPFPVLIRTSFGTSGAHIPAILRSLVACGWFGIQTWIGGAAIYEIVKQMWPGVAAMGNMPAFMWMLPDVPLSIGAFACFILFWLLHMWIVWAGVDSIKKFEAWAAPILIVIGLALGLWAYNVGGGLISTLEASDAFTRPTVTAERTAGEITVRLDLLMKEDGSPRATALRYATGPTEADAKKALEDVLDGIPVGSVLIPASPEATYVAVRVSNDAGSKFDLATRIRQEDDPPPGNWWLTIFLPLLTAMVGYWATLSLNIPDFSRYAKSQKDQLIGQAVGLPTTMTLYAFVGVLATCASLIAFPDVLVSEQAPWDPVALLSRFESRTVLIISMFALALATISTNIAANVVAPAVGFSNLLPQKISFKVGGYITGVIGILIMPWKMLATAGAYLFTWLIGYSALLGGIAGVMIADYYVLRRAKVDQLELYKVNGIYSGINWAGVVAFVLGVLPNIPGFLVQGGFADAESVPGILQSIYTYAWFVSFGIAFVAYIPLSKVFGVQTQVREVREG